MPVPALTPELLTAAGGAAAGLLTAVGSLLVFRREREKLRQEDRTSLSDAEARLRGDMSGRIAALEQRHDAALKDIGQLERRAAGAEARLEAIRLWRCPAAGACQLFPGTGRPDLPAVAPALIVTGAPA